MLALNNQKAFSILELLISLAIFSFLLFLITNFLMFYYQRYHSFLEKDKLFKTELYLKNRLQQKIGNANDIKTANLDELCVESEAKEICYTLSIGRLKEVEAGSTHYLTDKDYITSLSFDYPSKNLITVSMQFSLNQKIIEQNIFLSNMIID